MIEHVQSTPKMILYCHDRSNHIQPTMKTRPNNKVTDHIGMVYIETKTELSVPTRLGAVCDENKIKQ